MLRIVDCTDTHVIQKMVTAKGYVHYQTIPTDMIGKTQAMVHSSLRDARRYINRVINVPERITKSKKDYPEQQKGYSKAR